MIKRLQIALSDEARAAVELLTKDANENFDGGSINYSDVINEMIVCARVDVKALQLKHTDLKRSLIALAKKPDIDVETVMKCLSELKGRPTKKKGSAIQQEML